MFWKMGHKATQGTQVPRAHGAHSWVVPNQNNSWWQFEMRDYNVIDDRFYRHSDLILICQSGKPVFSCVLRILCVQNIGFFALTTADTRRTFSNPSVYLEG
jgi:hypothetical protein